MPTISGKLKFDRARTAVDSAGLSGIANVPVVLQDVTSGDMLAVSTDSNGNYTFNNVPDGDYQIVEYYGISPVVNTPGDFNTAIAGSILSGGVTPPISYVSNPPMGATNLDCTSPNTILITVAGSNLINRNILNGPVRYTPITTIMDSHAIVSPINLLAAADYGTFGSFPPGTPVNTYAASNPYPGIGSGFKYVQSAAPHDGEFTIGNIDIDGGSGSTWWRFSDHSTGNETNRMMIINGHNPGALIYQETVALQPNTYYLFSAWILNMIKVSGFKDPALGVQILDANSQIIVDQTLGQLIPVNPNTPEWVQIGSVIYSGMNTTLTVKFISQGPAALGNDYAIDDIELSEVTMPDLAPVKKCSADIAFVGDIVTYTVTLKNIFDRTIKNVMFQDTIPEGLTFVPGSLKINGVSQSAADPKAGVALPDIDSGDTVTVTFSAVIDNIPPVNPTINTAEIDYVYTTVEGGVPNNYYGKSNEVPLFIEEIADVAVVKTAGNNSVKPGDTLIYTITVTNYGPENAENVVFADNIPSDLLNPQYSLNNGSTWQPWDGSIDIGTMANGYSLKVLIKGMVDTSATEPLVNTATVTATTYDPNLKNNTSTVTTNITGPRCQAIADVIESVALQETALSHILNAEGEKMQAMLAINGVTAKQLLELNSSVSNLIRAVSRLEMILQSKLSLISGGCKLKS